MPTSVREFFDRKLPDLLRDAPAKVADVAAVYRFEIAGPDGGTWTVNLLSSPPTCVSGSAGAAQCTVACSDADFRAMIDGGVQAAMQMFFTGRIKVTGDPSLAAKLSKLLTATRP